MSSFVRPFCAVVLILLCIFTTAVPRALAQDAGSDADIAALEQKIAEYKKQLTVLGTQKQTLQSAIQGLGIQMAQITAQISVTQRKIGDANATLKSLGVQIAGKEVSIDLSKSAVASSLREIARADDIPLASTIFSSDSLTTAWAGIDADMQLADNLRGHTSELFSAKAVLADRQTVVNDTKAKLSALNADLAAQKKQLDASKVAKQRLLTETQNSEANYQKLLAAAQTQLASFQAFTAGGRGLLGNLTVCDTWGCYYNQRDTAWGGKAMNGTQYTLASAGCLITSLAMVMTHYGYKTVTPASINANPNNFAAYYPAFLLKTVSVAGVTATRVASTIDATLATGNPVIVGMKFHDGSTHFVVLTSGRAGVYNMRDPYFADSKDVPFSSRYSLASVYEVEKVVVSG